MSAGFTPGPWIVGEGGVSKQIPIMADDRVVVCELDGFSCDVSADASLIAAAPTLYDAAQVAMTAIRPLTDQGEDRIWRAAVKAMDALSAASAKARGQ